MREIRNSKRGVFTLAILALSCCVVFTTHIFADNENPFWSQLYKAILLLPSRIYLGIHWAFDKTEGIKQGRLIADYVFNKKFRPVTD
jgi:hypothetical protein